MWYKSFLSRIVTVCHVSGSFSRLQIRLIMVQNGHSSHDECERKSDLQRRLPVTIDQSRSHAPAAACFNATAALLNTGGAAQRLCLATLNIIPDDMEGIARPMTVCHGATHN
jgi:GTP cyclohydrolase III